MIIQTEENRIIGTLRISENLAINSSKNNTTVYCFISYTSTFDFYCKKNNGVQTFSGNILYILYVFLYLEMR